MYIFNFEKKTMILSVKSSSRSICGGQPLESSPINIRGKSVHGFLSYDRTDKQTDKRRL